MSECIPTHTLLQKRVTRAHDEFRQSKMLKSLASNIIPHAVHYNVQITARPSWSFSQYGALRAGAFPVMLGRRGNGTLRYADSEALPWRGGGVAGGGTASAEGVAGDQMLKAPGGVAGDITVADPRMRTAICSGGILGGGTASRRKPGVGAARVPELSSCNQLGLRTTSVHHPNRTHIPPCGPM